MYIPHACADSRLCKEEVDRKGFKFNGLIFFRVFVSRKNHSLGETVKIHCFCNKTKGFCKWKAFFESTLPRWCTGAASDPNKRVGQKQVLKSLFSSLSVAFCYKNSGYWLNLTVSFNKSFFLDTNTQKYLNPLNLRPFRSTSPLQILESAHRLRMYICFC